MKKSLSLILAVIMLLGMCVMTSCSGGSKIIVGTGGPTGTYFAYTQAVGKVLGEKTGLQFDVVSTGGSAANLKGLRDGDYKMAIVQNDTMINAYNNLDPDNFPAAITNFSVLGEVYSEVIQIVVKGDLKDSVKTLADLKGMRVSVGDAGSGVYNNAKELFAMYGMDIDKDIVQNNLSVGDSANAMKDGNLDAFFFTSGAPTTAITELITAMDIFLLSLEDQVMADFIASHKIDGQYEVYGVMPITNAQYSCIPEGEAVNTIGVTATFVVSNDLSEDDVYNMTKALWENIDAIAQGHVIAKSMDINAATITIGNVPVHPGAAKYYAEVSGQ